MLKHKDFLAGYNAARDALASHPHIRDVMAESLWDAAQRSLLVHNRPLACKGILECLRKLDETGEVPSAVES